MFKVYDGLTFGEGCEATGEFSSPVEARASMENYGVCSMVIEQSSDNAIFTLLYIKTGSVIFNCLTGELVAAKK